MEVILINKNFEKNRTIHLSHSFFVPVTLVSMLTVATVGYSAYSHYSGQSSNHVLSWSSQFPIAVSTDYKTPETVNKVSSPADLEDFTQRVNALETEKVRLNNWGRKLIVTTQESDMSLPWDQNIIEQRKRAAQIQAQSAPKQSSELKTILGQSSMSGKDVPIKRPVRTISNKPVKTVSNKPLPKLAFQGRTLPTQRMLVSSQPTQPTQLNKGGKHQLVMTSQAQKSDFSLSWDKLIYKQPHLAQNLDRTSHSHLSPIRDLQRSIQIVSRDLLRQYRSKVKSLPEGWPLKQGRISSKYGWRGRRMHKGLDIAAKRGTPVFTVEDGVVVRSKYVRGYGNLVEIQHSDMYSTRYGHNSKNLVKVGAYVSKGQVIALVGSTGRSSGPHVHFEVRQSKVAINPLKYLGAIEHFTLTDNIKLSEYVKLSKR
ncbi:MAG: hypothetical protein DRQ49_03840 [Gammaproteobacteria bacterium]|nr:MAG: hypothetical protein DRQ49_03840 [Gammaproteobacteria bacterium]RKZ75923.1 MAG: hypothetical protein DRQ57_05710 [Gammaproteobacteria bacterium]